jgi:hypothetical protein
VGLEILDIFQDAEGRLLDIHDFQNVLEEVSLFSVLKALTVPSNTEWLTGKPCTQNIEIRKLRSIHSTNVIMNIHTLVGLVDGPDSGINVASKDTLKVFKCGMKGTQSAEEVDVLERHTQWCLG